MREVVLPSGAVLKVTPSPFAVSKALYQALLAELKSVPIDSKMDMAAVWKDLFCIGFSSPKIEACIWKCFERCLYSDLKMDDQTFEPVERRDDYMKVCMEVVKENVLPFAKSLFAEFQHAVSTLESTQA